ncbi:COG1361 S-layer family protein [Methanothermococcus sp.]|uniref:COG1361 S-layer family protein n=1 Tax=Methanothermococcus sp. TaxID=2614238 RepID=UPI0025E93E30|nr:COG1361 S-layer family protein [Methanothermococcus sp.]
MKKLYYIFVLAVFLTTSINYGLTIDNPQYRVDKLIPDEKSPNIIHPGDDVDLWFKITNNNYNNNVKNIRITITPHYPFEIKQVNSIKGTYTISHLNPGESDTAYFKLHIHENAPSGYYRIDVNVSYDEVEHENGEDITRHYEWSKIYHLPIYGIANFEIYTKNITLTPGKTDTMDILLKNKGTGIAKYLTVNLKGTKNVNILGATTFYLKSVKPGENNKISAKIYATTKADDGIYPIIATIYWIGEDGGLYNSTIPINIRVCKKIYNNSVFIYLNSYKYKPDGSEIDIGVANRGSTSVKHCVLKISGITELNNNYIKYIGDLSEDDYDIVSYNVYGRLNETLPVKVDLTYFDNYHNKYHISKTFNITFKEYAGVKSNINYYYILIIGLLILAILYYIHKKRKKKEDIEKYEE